jgi:2,5-diamino-6-(ribosylamino)-4(3H)-pyrimidinone 5'-phosphate reductase
MPSSSFATSPPEFLARCLPAPSSRPNVTVTWAQSLDSKIAGPGGKRVILSGEESMLMTHWWVLAAIGIRIKSRKADEQDERSMHDAILVGVNTVIMDDPRLQSTTRPLLSGRKTELIF